jgi:hypothetical protein
MAAARDTTAANVRPLEGAIVRRYTAGSTVVAGEFVSMASDGQVDPAITTSATLAKVIGVAIQSVGANERVDVVVLGPVVCMTGATVGATIFATDTAGEPGESAGTTASVAGFAESATVLFVRPEIQ